MSEFKPVRDLDHLITFVFLGGILFLVVLLFPNTIETRYPSNSLRASRTLPVLVTAQQQFYILRKKVDASGKPQYGTFSELNSHEMVDDAFVNGYKSGYNFTMTVIDHKNFTIHASPVSESDGERMFYVDQRGVVTYSTVSLPDASSAKSEW